MNQRELESTTLENTINLIDLIKFANDVEAHIRKLILQKGKKNWKKMSNGCILHEIQKMNLIISLLKITRRQKNQEETKHKNLFNRTCYIMIRQPKLPTQNPKGIKDTLPTKQFVCQLFKSAYFDKHFLSNGVLEKALGRLLLCVRRNHLEGTFVKIREAVCA